MDKKNNYFVCTLIELRVVWLIQFGKIILSSKKNLIQDSFPHNYCVPDFNRLIPSVQRQTPG
ncbi:hypothetical protein NITGR_980030 [Nitrospina gracilis 3/211]|uniref:Uncharacterized protein n=1 Tax=Nitrospina gracilis (strain 3/211) TaxID=1266370 RepID=M1Z353_NITG3|nr:hypothetical protein NITGR_980030 [Nitrospina gracilis 3/211]